MIGFSLKFSDEKATKVCDISSVDLSYVVPVKSKVKISQNFKAFSEYMNFNRKFMIDHAGFRNRKPIL